MTDWDGTAYQQVAGLQRWLGERALAGVGLRGDERVLDVGCGDGRLTARLAALLPRGQVVGIDPSPRMIEAARQLADPPRVSFRAGDLLAMTFQAQFDLVVSFNVLHWVTNQGAGLDRIRAALRSPGRALLVFVAHGPRPSLERVAMSVCASPDWRRYFTGFADPFVHPDPQQYAALARSAGFTVSGQHLDDLSWDFGSPQAFRRWCRVGFGVWTDRLPDDATAERFVDQVAAAYADTIGSAQTFRFMQLRLDLTC